MRTIQFYFLMGNAAWPPVHELMSMSKTNLKVLILSMEYSPGVSGGVGTHVQELAAGLTFAGDRVTLLAGTVGSAERFVEGKKTVHLVPPENPQQAGRSLVQGILDYNRTLAAYARKVIFQEEAEFDLVHCHNWITYPAAAEIAGHLGIPIVCTVHYLSHPVERRWGQTPDPEIVEQEKILFRNAKTFIAVSESIRTLMCETYAIPKRSVRVIYNSIDIGAFLRAAIPKRHLDLLRKLVSPRDEKIVLYTGRFHPMKGIPALLKSALLVLEKEPNVRYVMAGEPDSKAFALELRDLLNQHPILRKKLTMLGKLSRRHVAVLYAIANVALLPSVYDPCPYAAIEAMAAGVPLVASNGGGLAELVEHGVTGLKAPVKFNEAGVGSVDPEDFAQATLLLLREEDLARQFGNAARQKAAVAHSPEVMVGATKETYLSALRQAEGSVA
jgi:glycosyltransferase involved in cell wall biosynthesis